MAELQNVTAPLVIRFADGSEKVAAACFPHPEGMIYLDLFWHQTTPDKAAHILPGQLTGEGPWKVGSTIIRVLGCRNTDPHLQDAFSQWKDYLQSSSGLEYPSRPQILRIARRLGAKIELSPEPESLQKNGHPEYRVAE